MYIHVVFVINVEVDVDITGVVIPCMIAYSVSLQLTGM